ncbi:MAG: peptidylprolyl isomerase [Saprospiraceae bacterium]|nr:peptidylprolyl isomerase [Saprospiraceae bacterium]
MGMISSIRKRLWVVTVLMALALVGFIVMDMTSGKSSSLLGNPDTVGSVGGESLTWKDFQNTERILYSNSEVDYFGRKDYLWNQFVEKTILEKDAKCNGTGVSPAEIKELEFGYNLSPIVQRNFRDPNTGQINREQLNTFKQGIEDENLDPRLKDFWMVQEQEIIKDRLSTKLNALVVKSLYMPNFMIERNQYESNLKLDFLYTIIPYDIVNDSDIIIEDSDYEAQAKEKEALLKTDEETRSVKYVILDIIPTAEDSAQIKTSISSKIEGLKTSTDDSTFVVSNLGKWEDAYQKEFEISPALKDTIYKLEKGMVYGPYIDNGEYRIAKVIDKKVIPDSVKSRHILIQVQTREQYQAAVKLLDSLMNQVKTGRASFDSLATKYSQDPGSAVKGGDLGFVATGRMVKPFNDAIFYELAKGEMKLVITQFGLHLIQVTDAIYDNAQLGVHLAIIGETILPGESISNLIYDEAQNLVQENRSLDALEKAVKDGGKYKIDLAGNLFINSYQISKLGAKASSTCRDIVRWAFSKDTKKGDVSTEIYSLQEDEKKYVNKYVVASLFEIKPKGIGSYEPFKDILKGEILKNKKFEKIKATLGQIAELTLGLGGYTYKIDTALGVSPYSGYITNLGDETKVISSLVKLNEGQSSQALMGEKGAFICKLIKKDIPPAPTTIEAFRHFYIHPAKNVAMTYLMTAMKKQFKIKDNRSKFF